MISKIKLGFGIFFVLILVAAVFGTLSLTGFSVFTELDSGKLEFDYIYTTAICEGNECRDFEIHCLDGEAIRMDPVTGLVVFPDDWEDPREREKDNRELCSR